jgi:AGCS family alanine or glycine:cation symporter
MNIIIYYCIPKNMNQLFIGLDLFEDAVWAYLGVPLIVALGLYFSVTSRFFQVRRLPAIMASFLSMMGPQKEGRGVHPIKVFFAAVGGCIGIGNIVAVCTAVQIGGPGAIFWLWIAGGLGMLIKYSEVYLGILTRKKNDHGGYDGGPMYFLPRAFSAGWVPKLACALLCVYGVEVYMFRIIADSISLNAGVSHVAVSVVLLPLVLFGGIGGIRRVGDISSAVIPLFLVLFSGMCLWILYLNAAQIPAAFGTIFHSAFTPHAPVGAFVGSTMLVTISQGVKRACYTGDIGVGYASVIHSETSLDKPHQQAGLAVFGIFLDTFVVCTLSLLLVVVTDVWMMDLPASSLLQEALGRTFPGMGFFMPLFIFLLGYSTMIAFLAVGVKCAEFLSPKWGRGAYAVYAALSMVAFTFIDTDRALTLMSAAGAMLLLMNLVGIFRLRHEIKFE